MVVDSVADQDNPEALTSTMNIIQHLICAHLIGDLLLQNQYMAAHKSTSNWACTLHVISYSVPFWLAAWCLLIPVWIIPLILMQHWLQDRYLINLAWMRHFSQSSAADWPNGPFLTDQTMHIAFMWWLSLLT